jgi:hypothetical protein
MLPQDQVEIIVGQKAMIGTFVRLIKYEPLIVFEKGELSLAVRIPLPGRLEAPVPFIGRRYRIDNGQPCWKVYPKIKIYRGALCTIPIEAVLYFFSNQGFRPHHDQITTN